PAASRGREFRLSAPLVGHDPAQPRSGSDGARDDRGHAGERQADAEAVTEPVELGALARPGVARHSPRAVQVGDTALAQLSTCRTDLARDAVSATPTRGARRATIRR